MKNLKCLLGVHKWEYVEKEDFAYLGLCQRNDGGSVGPVPGHGDFLVTYSYKVCQRCGKRGEA